MERYCIRCGKADVIYEGKLNHEAGQGIKIDRITMFRMFENPKNTFEEDISSIIYKINEEGSRKEENVSEVEMYRNVLISILTETDLIKLDMYLHTYYTLMYERNKDSYIPLASKEWEKSQRNKMHDKRKNYKFKNNRKRSLPFEILEKEGGKSVKGSVNEETKIPDFAPDAIRLAYLSKEFRTVFEDVKKVDAKKFGYSEIQGIFVENADLIEFSRKEEIWLEERLLAVNLAWAFHSFFYPIFQNMPFAEVQRKFGELIEGIIHEAMKWEGLYSRMEFIMKLKVIYEIRSRAVNGMIQILPEKEIPHSLSQVVTGRISDVCDYNDAEKPIYNNIEGEIYACQEPEDTIKCVECRYDTLEQLLEYLYRYVLCENMEELAGYYKEKEARVYKELKEMLNSEEVLGFLEEEIDNLLKKFFNGSSGYYLLKDVVKYIEDGNGEESGSKESEDADKDRKKSENEPLSPRLYRYIQKTVIKEQLKGQQPAV